MIFKLEFKSTFKGLLLWTGIVAAVLILFMAIYPSMQGPAMKDLIETKLGAMPEGLMAAVGLDDFPDLADISQYFAYTFQYIMLAGGIYAAILGASTLIKEETDGTIEYLYAQPVTRSQIAWGKLLSSLATLTAFYMITTIVSVILILIFQPEGSDMFTLVSGLKTMITGALFTSVIFLAIGFLVSTLLKSAKQSSPIAIGIVFGTYVLGIFSKTVSDKVEVMEYLKYVSPLDYAMPLSVLKNGFEPLCLLIGAVIIVVSIPVAFLVYRRKDLKS